MWTLTNARRGVTLVELLASITVLTIIAPILVMITSNYLGVYGRTFASLSLTTSASSMQQTVSTDLTNLSRLVVAETDQIAFRIARSDDHGIPTMPFDRDGALLAYYLSDDSGDPDVEGSTLWLARTPADSTELEVMHRVLRHVDDIRFTYLDTTGAAFSEDALADPSFDDLTLAWVRVEADLRHPGASGLSAPHEGTASVIFQVAPRNNHE